MNERRLSERLPFPLNKVCFLGGEPYRFKIAPAPDGKSTLIDWNWNGILGEESVVADTNYTHGVDFGPQFTIDRTAAAPALVAHGDRPLMVYAKGSALTLRTWTGADRAGEGGQWSPETIDRDAGLIGDPTAVYLDDGLTWIAYPTADGTVLRSAMLDGEGGPQLGEPGLLSRTRGVQPTA
ncbi:hypothetical protein EON79_19010 [bacterium]|nr:MAG: hypothetical protein EON79_19010 [bacterium]